MVNTEIPVIVLTANMALYLTKSVPGGKVLK